MLAFASEEFRACCVVRVPGLHPSRMHTLAPASTRRADRRVMGDDDQAFVSRVKCCTAGAQIQSSVCMKSRLYFTWCK